jgi:hypothetical protein
VAAGILSVAWNILRGAVVASTEMVTVGGVVAAAGAGFSAAAVEIVRIAMQVTPESKESFIVLGPSCFLVYPTAHGGI